LLFVNIYFKQSLFSALVPARHLRLTISSFLSTCLMPDNSLNASPNSAYHTFDPILAQFEPSFHEPEAFLGPAGSPQDPEQDATLQHQVVPSPQVRDNELGIYDGPIYTEDYLSPLEAFNETTEPLATHTPEPLYQEPPGHIRSPILSK
jgi:hypothetical protein